MAASEGMRNPSPEMATNEHTSMASMFEGPAGEPPLEQPREIDLRVHGATRTAGLLFRGSAGLLCRGAF